MDTNPLFDTSENCSEPSPKKLKGFDSISSHSSESQESSEESLHDVTQPSLTLSHSPSPVTSSPDSANKTRTTEEKRSADLEIQMKEVSAHVAELQSDLNEVKSDLKEVQRILEQLVTNKEKVAEDGQEMLHQNGYKHSADLEIQMKEASTHVAELKSDLNEVKSDSKEVQRILEQLVTNKKKVAEDGQEMLHQNGDIMWPSLTAGSINRILAGKKVSVAVMQVLSCKKIPTFGNDRYRLIPTFGNDRYRLLISDGVTGCPFAFLGTQFNSLVANKELEKFTIVKVDKYACYNIQPDRKVIILLNLTVLVPGAEVNEKIGNPINSSSTSLAASAADATADVSNE